MPAFRYGMALMQAKPLHYLGHNPLGSLLILAMVAAVAAQAITGLFTTDDTLAQGPLYAHVSEAASARASSYHAVGFWIIVGLAVVHVLANAVYEFILRDRLISAMITGRKLRRPYLDQQEARFAPQIRAALCLVLSAGIVAGVLMLSGESLLR
jgi:cytochrome b